MNGDGKERKIGKNREEGEKKKEKRTKRKGWREGLKGDKGRGKGRVSTLRSKKYSIDISYTVAEHRRKLL